MNSAVYATLIKLCVDICKRNGKKKLIWFGDKDKTLNYSPKSDEMILTVHRWFANKSCPGNWLYARLGDLASKVTAQLGGAASTPAGGRQTPVSKFPAVPFTVKVIIDDLNYRSEPSMNGKVNGQTGKGVFTIMEVRDGWGRLKSGAGWIYLENPSYCTIGNTSSSAVKTTTKSVDTLAREVIQGKWGNGTDRKNRLTAAGYNYSAVQKRVNELLKYRSMMYARWRLISLTGIIFLLSGT